MIRHYLRISLRHIFKNKLHSFITIFGLSLGLAVGILSYLYVHNELSYDNFHKNGDRVFMASHTKFEPDGSSEGYYVHAPIPFGPAMKQDIPEIEHFIRFSEQTTFVRSRKLTDEENLLMAERPFFEVFSFTFKNGTARNSLRQRNSVVLSESLAQKYFGEDDPTGKNLDVLLGEKYLPLTVMGVVEEIPANSSFKFDIVVPYDLLDRFEWFRERQNSWNSWNSPTYVLLKENARIEEVEEKMIPFWEKYKGENFSRQRASGEWTFAFQPIETKFVPLKNVHYADLRFGGAAETSNPVYVYYIGAIALGILLIACINFINLFISRSSSRTNEIAVRKVIGAEKRNLIAQFLSEAVLVSLFALLAAMLLVQLMLPTFSSMVSVDFQIDSLSDFGTIFAVLVISLLTGLIAGAYPAFLLSSFQPIQVFSHKLKFGGSNTFSKVLIVFQFTVTSFFLIGTMGISQQLSFIQNKDLGFDKEQVVIIRGNFQRVDAERVMELFKNRFENDPDIDGISGVSYSFNRGYDRVGFENSLGQERRAHVYRVDENFIGLLGIEVIKGRDFNLDISSNTENSVIVNEALVRDFEMESGVGEQLDGFVNRGLENPAIVGVVRDFHFSSLKDEIGPVIMHMNAVDEINYVLAKLNPYRISGGLDKLQRAWNDVVPELPFQYSFLDDDLNRQYDQVQLRRNIVSYSTGLAVFIAVIGLFGLSAYSAEKRKKEIGIRKILGASVLSIMQLLGRKFVILVLIANVIAWPLSFYALQRWLENFAYRITLDFWLFFLSSCVTLFIAFVTVSYQVIKSSLSNPVESLRYE